MLTGTNAKNASKFICEKCDFKCCKKSNYEKHLSTRKHKSLTCLTEKEQKMLHHICSGCGKEYKSREGIWYHKKKNVRRYYLAKYQKQHLTKMKTQY